MVNVSPRPETDEERLAVWDWMEHMLLHPDGLYDGMTVAYIRHGMGCYLAGYRHEGLPQLETSRDASTGCDDVNERS
ncbi:hypothetical protein ABW16_21700 [Mycolicibacter heraklionensis]|uniref:Uncharacterized protein n=1 Tax=Mycolicibacter heraklionensis TaxID=512402 RepID=A0ABR5FA34_9MYCO|nr:hypothetical protein ABW16_21700 [Mycolicibacter heraklionensis]